MINNSILFIGIDLGDKFSVIVVLDQDGEVIEESRIPTTQNAFTRKFMSFTPSRIAMEVGTHSRWVSQTLKEFDHEVIVADARKLRLIYDNPRKKTESTLSTSHDWRASIPGCFPRSFIEVRKLRLISL
jgi:molecular chaperone DnaK (HSP70)